MVDWEPKNKFLEILNVHFGKVYIKNTDLKQSMINCLCGKAASIEAADQNLSPRGIFQNGVLKNCIKFT